jgi:tRNA(Ile)-lysidine synthase
MDATEQKVMEFIRLHGLFAGAGGILLAVSGGADSIALLHILESLRANGLLSAKLICAHVNHQLRGSESDGDERFVVEQATRLAMPVVTRAVDVRACAKAHRLSLETAARQLRLAALSDIAKAQECTWVATGHQKNDNAETVIQRLHRGTGVRGLAGIWPARRFGDGLWLARPMLDLSRAEILAYLGGKSVSWREDHTNVDPAYTRNYIRHKLLPALQRDAHMSLADQLSELAASARKLYQRIQRDAEKTAAELTQSSEGKTVISVAGLAALPEPVAAEMMRLALVGLGCSEENLKQDHYERLLQLARSPVGGKMITLPEGFTARREYEKVIFTAPRQDARPAGLASASRQITESRPYDGEGMPLQIPGQTQFAGWRIEASILDRETLSAGQIKGDKSPFCEYFDFDRIRQPVVVRFRCAADRFWPLGLAGEKKLGKFLTAAKVPREVRADILVFADRERIVWVCPVRIAETAKVTEQTQRVLMLKVTHGSTSAACL